MAPLPIKFTELVNVRLARYPFFSVAAAAALLSLRHFSDCISMPRNTHTRIAKQFSPLARKQGMHDRSGRSPHIDHKAEEIGP